MLSFAVLVGSITMAENLDDEQFADAVESLFNCSCCNDKLIDLLNDHFRNCAIVIGEFSSDDDDVDPEFDSEDDQDYNNEFSVTRYDAGVPNFEKDLKDYCADLARQGTQTPQRFALRRSKK